VVACCWCWALAADGVYVLCKYNKAGQYFDQHSIILSLSHGISLIFICILAVLVFLEIAVSLVAISVLNMKRCAASYYPNARE
jgi:hypothetical protein